MLFLTLAASAKCRQIHSICFNVLNTFCIVYVTEQTCEYDDIPPIHVHIDLASCLGV